MKKKICCVVQRYGIEVNGGAELHCRQISERLVPYYDVDVLTTKAIDYMTWKDEYDKSEEFLNGVHVRRFSVEQERDIQQFNQINDRFMRGDMEASEEKNWMDAQGPMVPKLIDYIRKHKNDYDVFLFFTYLYYQTANGIPIVKEKAILVPDAHDEPFLRMQIFNKVFKEPKAIFFNTDDERVLVRRKYQNWKVRCRIGGAGVDLPEDISAKRFKEKYHLDEYIIYVGRIDAGKNCDQLFQDFIAYKNKYPGNLKLVLMGKNVISVPEHPDIVALGFVDEQDKFDGISGARFLVLPSKFESLSIVVLEAFSLKIPVLVNSACEVLKSHCIKSQGGLYYENTEEFCEAIHYMINNEGLCRKMGEYGKIYVNRYYQWDVVIRKLRYLIEYVIKSNQSEEK
ncbi:glycosyltransferase family 4 protein [Frisingicoccus sp.]|uniref:glycosyltransferase family 4 protein n=1 Tax=Frisingicoccus sp. TaxID=1918627 RepID=UPI003AB2A962